MKLIISPTSATVRMSWPKNKGASVLSRAILATKKKKNYLERRCKCILLIEQQHFNTVHYFVRELAIVNKLSQL